MKKILIFLFVAITNLAFAQVDSVGYWKFSGNNSLNFSQVSFTNWSSGGENSISLNLLMDYSANYLKKNFSCDNNLIIGYGFSREGDEKLKKSDDRIDFSTKMGLKASEHWNYSGILAFKTQFAKGYKYPERKLLSGFMSPAYLLFGLGMDYKPSDDFSLLITPAALKMTIVNNDTLVEAFGIDMGKNVRSEFGASLKAVYKKELVTNVILNTKIELYSNYFEKFTNVDVLWDIIVNMKINSFLSTNLVVNMLYDDDVKTVNDDGTIDGAKMQMMQLFGVGLTYNF